MSPGEQGWQLFRAFRTTDAEGRPTDLQFGLVDTAKNGTQPAIRVDGKTALMPLEEIGAELPEVIRRVLLTWWQREGGR
ncbi:hypothetical protein [Amycolatopsis sp. NPDC003861]